MSTYSLHHCFETVVQYLSLTAFSVFIDFHHKEALSCLIDTGVILKL
jgi:hypothetical protein